MVRTEHEICVTRRRSRACDDRWTQTSSLLTALEACVAHHAMNEASGSQGDLADALIRLSRDWDRLHAAAMLDRADWADSTARVRIVDREIARISARVRRDRGAAEARNALHRRNLANSRSEYEAYRDRLDNAGYDKALSLDAVRSGRCIA